MEGIHLHAFHVILYTEQGRHIICPSWKDDLYSFMSGFIAYRGQFCKAIGGSPDHVHMLIMTKPECHLAQLLGELKSITTAFAEDRGLSNELRWMPQDVSITCAWHGRDNLAHYINSQEMLHAIRTTTQELEDLMDLLEADVTAEQVAAFKPQSTEQVIHRN